MAFGFLNKLKNNENEEEETFDEESGENTINTIAKKGDNLLSMAASLILIIPIA